MWKKIFGKSATQKNEVTPVDIERSRLPRHVAVIMDGNGRWAKGQGFLRTVGHRAGVDTLHDILDTAIDLKLEVLTVYAFSTENWKRPHDEVDFLMRLFSEYLDKEEREMHEKNVRIRFIGRVDELSPELIRRVRHAEELMKNNTGVHFCVAVNYGGQDEICRAVQGLAGKVQAGELSPEEITPELFQASLDTKELPPVDLVIRTSGDMRLSNFLLWQAAYAEFWFTETNWPDFKPECFMEALRDYASRERRFGGIKGK